MGHSVFLFKVFTLLLVKFLQDLSQNLQLSLYFQIIILFQKHFLFLEREVYQVKLLMKLLFLLQNQENLLLLIVLKTFYLLLMMIYLVSLNGLKLLLMFRHNNQFWISEKCTNKN